MAASAHSQDARRDLYISVALFSSLCDHTSRAFAADLLQLLQPRRAKKKKVVAEGKM
jgi:hypothetical protein